MLTYRLLDSLDVAAKPETRHEEPEGHEALRPTTRGRHQAPVQSQQWETAEDCEAPRPATPRGHQAPVQPQQQQFRRECHQSLEAGTGG